ncbi:uncharacterized protein DUF4269 [Salsuginibacillus halophilus]|uniref:Uncharacterized protein DUF4269 n=1 Tax=Salsuginibacillus halophilus TaxID=517424 RepID=A0A2P8H896_9BACI|nr:DUF4269 domain-containing protein [Salsuginibacillus halophilus]PSL42424.1 uncharacterized protein DUF4269 [Salsuginibacillus halophilus]
MLLTPDFASQLQMMQFGTLRQQQAAAVCKAYDLPRRLASFQPIMTGTIPLGIEHDASDIDIACSTKAPTTAIRTLHEAGLTSYITKVKTRPQDAAPAVVITMQLAQEIVECYISTTPSVIQPSYRHMLIEARLLEIGDPSVTAQIKTLKQRGFKTEPAFARCFFLPGDPYITLYAMSFWSGLQLLKWHDHIQRLMFFKYFRISSSIT